MPYPGLLHAVPGQAELGNWYHGRCHSHERTSEKRHNQEGSRQAQPRGRARTSAGMTLDLTTSAAELSRSHSIISCACRGLGSHKVAKKGTSWEGSSQSDLVSCCSALSIALDSPRACIYRSMPW